MPAITERQPSVAIGTSGRLGGTTSKASVAPSRVRDQERSSRVPARARRRDRELRSGDVRARRRREMLTLNQLADEYLAQHVCEANTLATLTWRLKRARDTFGETRVDRLAVNELGLASDAPGRSAYWYVKALRQLLHYAVAVGLVARRHDQDPEPSTQAARDPDVRIAGGSRSRRCGDGSRIRRHPDLRRAHRAASRRVDPLERRDVDDDGVHVRRVYTDGQIKPTASRRLASRRPAPGSRSRGAKRDGSRLDTRLLFPRAIVARSSVSTTGDEQDWRPALRAAGLEHRSPYALRHTYASFAIAAGVSPSNSLASWALASQSSTARTAIFFPMQRPGEARA